MADKTSPRRSAPRWCRTTCSRTCVAPCSRVPLDTDFLSPTQYMIKTMQSPSELWHIRKQMTLQMASFIFATYVLSMGARVPSRIHISRSSGKMYTSDMLPCALSFLLRTRRTPAYASSNLSYCPVEARVRQHGGRPVPLHAQHAALRHADRYRGPTHLVHARHRALPDRVRGASSPALSQSSSQR